MYYNAYAQCYAVRHERSPSTTAPFQGWDSTQAPCDGKDNRPTDKDVGLNATEQARIELTALTNGTSKYCGTGPTLEPYSGSFFQGYKGCRGNRYSHELDFWWSFATAADMQKREECTRCSNALPLLTGGPKATFRVSWSEEDNSFPCAAECLATNEMVTEAIRLGMAGSSDRYGPAVLNDASTVFTDSSYTAANLVGGDTPAIYNAVQMAQFCLKNEQKFSYPRFCTCGGQSCLAPGFDWILEAGEYVVERITKFIECGFYMDRYKCCGAGMEPNKPGQHDVTGTYTNFGSAPGVTNREHGAPCILIFGSKLTAKLKFGHQGIWRWTPSSTTVGRRGNIHLRTGDRGRRTN
jgi:hypothetical protein